MAAELIPLLSSVLPGMSVSLQASYPAPGSLSSLLGAQGLRLCLLDMESDRETAFALVSQIISRRPGLPIIALLSGNDPDLILRGLRQGASEFLVRPFTADQLAMAAERLARMQPPDGHAQEKLGRLCCVLPGKGASGASSIACNLAYQFRRQGGKRVLLADMDPLTGTIAFQWKLKSQYSFVDALNHSDRLDADLWKVLVNQSNGVDVLLSPEDPVNGISVDWDAAGLMDYCRRAYDLIVIDSSGAYGDWNLSLAKLCDDLLVVTTNELPALHATQRSIAYLVSNGLARSQIRLLVNRYNPERGLDSEGIETALQSAVFQTLPSDYDAIQKALMDGKPVAPGSRLGKSVSTLAGRLAGGERPGRSDSVVAALSSLFNLR